jgi:alginate O-acetyltransferase complex protein AlgI
MVFSSNIFLFSFLPFTLFLYFLFPQKNYKNALLLLASLFFYAWGEPQYLALLLVSILGNYFFGLWIQSRNKPNLIQETDISTTGPRNKCGVTTHIQCHPALVAGSRKLKMKNDLFNSNEYKLFFAITFNLLLLGYFKYANFLIENLNMLFLLQIENKKIHLPIGISFFTFHAISYLIDIYRKKCRAQKNIFELALYIAFFPQLVAGPIVRYNFIEKYLGKRRHNFFFAAYGIRRFIIGLGKKIIIANPLGELADAIFNSPVVEINSTVAWVGIACYTLQIYFDFSGYSDMAVGLARIFGFKFPENFNHPYISRSIKEFWRRWHMSLSAWFRDYVYIPLGGNRTSLSRQYFNLILVFFLCGLWHGASWNFVIWGMFHGFFLVLERLADGSRNKCEMTAKQTKIVTPHLLRGLLVTPHLLRGLQNFYTIFIVMIGWVFFRSPDLTHALSFLKTMFIGNEIEVISSEILRLMRSHFLWMSAALALLGFSPLIKNLTLKLTRKNKIFVSVFDALLIAIFLFSLMRLSASTHNPFIYFQF